MKHYIDHINSLVRQSGELLEGNICYQHHSTDFDLQTYSDKQQQWQTLCRRVRTVIEIGFNAGHSSVLALCARSDLTYVGIDPLAHSYGPPCAQWLSEQFGARFSLIRDYSNPGLLLVQRPPWPLLWSIDGEHTLAQAQWDLEQVTARSRPLDLLWFDDADDPELHKVLEGRDSCWRALTWPKKTDTRIFIRQRK